VPVTRLTKIRIFHLAPSLPAWGFFVFKIRGKWKVNRGVIGVMLALIVAGKKPPRNSDYGCGVINCCCNGGSSRNARNSRSTNLINRTVART
jgi:hypothetical protein